MLEELHVAGLGVIDEATLQFAPGSNVLTGETGAGKTMITVALSLALGGRAGADLVRQGRDAASVEARFVDPPPGLAEWSLRWGIVIAVLGIGLALWRPRRAATRLLLCRLVLVGGLILPLLPRCWGPTIVSLPAATPAVEQAQQAPVPLTQQTAPPQSRQMASAAPAVAVTAQADSLSNPAALNVASPAAELKQSTPETARAQQSCR